MGVYKHIRNLWNNPDSKLRDLQKSRLIKWRKEPVTVKLDRPTRLDRARSLGYKAKQGIVVVRQRVSRGGRQRPDIKGGRRSKHSGQRKVVDKNYQQVAEERAARKFTNCEVLNSYFVGKDGKNYWYEVILVDRFHPQTLADPSLKKLTARKGRAYRGLTSAGRKGRGLRKKGKGTEKTRPGKTATYRRKAGKPRKD